MCSPKLLPLTPPLFMVILSLQLNFHNSSKKGTWTSLFCEFFIKYKWWIFHISFKGHNRSKKRGNLFCWENKKTIFIFINYRLFLHTISFFINTYHLSSFIFNKTKLKRAPSPPFLIKCSAFTDLDPMGLQMSSVSLDLSSGRHSRASKYNH